MTGRRTYLEFGDSKLLWSIRSSLNLWAALLLVGDLSSDALWAEGTWEKGVTLAAAERILALPSTLEVESIVVLKLSWNEIGPVEASALLWDTDFRLLGWALEWLGAVPLGGC